MATKKKTAAPKKVTRYSPHGTKVSVTEEQAKKLPGYTATKPKDS